MSAAKGLWDGRTFDDVLAEIESLLIQEFSHYLIQQKG